MKYYIIDALGPFINPKKSPYNWSKIPFQQYENSVDFKEDAELIEERFVKFIKTINQLGYNAISLDDLAHMVTFSFYDQNLKDTLNKFRELYQSLIKIAKEHDLKVFINTDLFFFNEQIEKHLKTSMATIPSLIKDALTSLFENYRVDGVISRIGECDGVDVEGLFKSKIVIKTPKQANNLLKEILPIFNKHRKKWIFRTWTIGGSRIGDLIWNKKTYSKVFTDVHNPNLIVSMKYGVSDFFRQMKLNPLFFAKDQKKIIELQTKREYDSFGELPYYTGFDYQEYYKQLKDLPDFSGISVWCQTGGWHKSDRITFLSNSSPYVELNTISTINIFKDSNAELELKKFFNNKNKIQFIKDFNRISTQILYPNNNDDAEHKELFINKLYVPPIVWNYWNNVSVNHLLASLIKYSYPEFKINESEFNQLHQLGKECQFENIDLYMDTLRILYTVRLTLQHKYSYEDCVSQVEKYKSKYKLLSFSLSDPKNTATIRKILPIMLRKQKNYRLIDKLLLNHLLSLTIKIYTKTRSKSLPKFVNSQSMPLNKLLK